MSAFFQNNYTFLWEQAIERRRESVLMLQGELYRGGIFRIFFFFLPLIYDSFIIVFAYFLIIFPSRVTQGDALC